MLRQMIPMRRTHTGKPGVSMGKMQMLGKLARGKPPRGNGDLCGVVAIIAALAQSVNAALAQSVNRWSVKLSSAI